MRDYIRKRKNRYNWSLLKLMLFFSILFLCTLTFEINENSRIIISSLLLPFALHSITRAMDDYFNSDNLISYLNEAIVFKEQGIINENEFYEIKKEIRTHLEEIEYVKKSKNENGCDQ